MDKKGLVFIICTVVLITVAIICNHEFEYAITGKVVDIDQNGYDLCLHILDGNNNTQEFTCKSYTLATPLWRINGKNVSVCWTQTLVGCRTSQSFELLDPIYS